MTGSLDSRARAAADWAAARLGTALDGFEPVSADASFRRYFRAFVSTGSYIVMDAPTQHEDCRPFLHVAGLMLDAGLNVPRVVDQDLTAGFLLLSDLGRQTYLEVLDSGNADALFEDALAALVRWQRASRPGLLPPYDEALLRRELSLFPDWYLGRHLGVVLQAGDLTDWRAVCDRLVSAALIQPRVFVHRDYMPRNLMLSTPNPGVLDFQDAVIGPLSYDVVCLFKDAFLSWPADRIERWFTRYWELAGGAGLPVGDYAEFRRFLDWMGLQRHLKVLGIFARIHYRDGKPRYLDDTPRFVRYVTEVAPRYPELAALSALFQKHVLPGLRS